jgi:hypothetical protein
MGPFSPAAGPADVGLVDADKQGQEQQPVYK